MKHTILTFFVVMLTVQLLSAQKEEIHESFFKETEWESEFFTFPIPFAREIPLKGIEEAVFPPGWGETESPEFWSYLFVWNVQAPAPLTVKELQTYLNYYFDGLLDIKNKSNGTTILPTSTLLTTPIGDRQFIGTVHLFEGRYTQKMMYLHTFITQAYCDKSQEATLVFRFSPKGFNDPIWNQFQDISLKDGMCPN